MDAQDDAPNPAVLRARPRRRATRRGLAEAVLAEVAERELPGGVDELSRGDL